MRSAGWSQAIFSLPGSVLLPYLQRFHGLPRPSYRPLTYIGTYICVKKCKCAPVYSIDRCYNTCRSTIKLTRGCVLFAINAEVSAALGMGLWSIVAVLS